MLSVFFVGSLSFLPHQSIWTDEATQMTGLSLSWGEMMRYLLHKTADLGVPFDRMPPLSYLLGKAWASFFGLTEYSMRVFGVFSMGAATALLFHGVYRHFGRRAALLAALCFACSSNILVLAVEIRAYPLFVMFATAALLFHLNLVERTTLRDLVGYVVATVAMIYTHYFGVVFFVASGAAMLFVRREKSLWLAQLAVVCASFGIIPFVKAACNLSSGGTATGGGFIRMGYRLVAYASHAYFPLVVLSLLLAAAFLSLRAILTERKCLSLFLTLLFGFGVVFIGQLLFSGFQATTPSYNAWMIPALFIILGVGMAKSRLMTATFVIANLIGATVLIAFGSYFSHGPYEQLARIVEDHGLKEVAVVHEQDSPHGGMVYFALRYLLDDKAVQFDALPSAIDQYQYVAVVHATPVGWRELIADIKGNDRKLKAGPWADRMQRMAGWHLLEEKKLSAWTAVQLKIFEKRRGRR